MNTTRLLTTFVLALATTTAISAGAPPAHGSKAPGKAGPPGGGANVVHEKVGASADKTSAALSEIEGQRDRALELLANDRDKFLASFEAERDRGLESAENDEQRAAVLATYREKREAVMSAYTTSRSEVMRDYAEQRAAILGTGADAADAAADRAAAPARPGVTEPDAAKPGIIGARGARTVRGDLGELEEAILQERETHAKRIETLGIARKRAKELGADDQIARIDTMIERETQRHADALKTLDVDRKDLEEELDRRRKEEDAADEMDDDEADAAEDDLDDDERKRRRANRDRKKDRDRDAEKDRDRDRDRHADRGRSARDIEREIQRENDRHAKRMEELGITNQDALTRGDRSAAQEVAEEMKVEQRRHAELYQKLQTELAAAGLGGAAERRALDLDDPQKAREELRRLRRRLAETDEDIDAEKRLHARRVKTLEKRIESAASVTGDRDAFKHKPQTEKARSQRTQATLTTRRASIEEHLEATRAAYGKLMRKEVRIDNRDELQKSLDELEKELGKSRKGKKGKGKNAKGG
jgi:hypothetical protein